MGRGYVGPRGRPDRPDVRRHPAPRWPWWPRGCAVRRSSRSRCDGRPVTLKLELLQHSGSFKVRGAFHSVLSAPEPTGDAGRRVRWQPRARRRPRRAPPRHRRPASSCPRPRRRSRSTRSPRWAPRSTASAPRTPRRSSPAARPPVSPGALALHAYDSFGTVAGQATLGVELAEQAARRRHGARRRGRWWPVLRRDREASPGLDPRRGWWRSSRRRARRCTARWQPVGPWTCRSGESRPTRSAPRGSARSPSRPATSTARVAAGQRRRHHRGAALAVARRPDRRRARRGHGPGSAAVRCATCRPTASASAWSSAAATPTRAGL